MKQDNISAFAFKLGKDIEAVINEKTKGLESQNQLLQAKIINWWQKNGKSEKFAKHFNIQVREKGES